MIRTPRARAVRCCKSIIDFVSFSKNYDEKSLKITDKYLRIKSQFCCGFKLLHWVMNYNGKSYFITKAKMAS